MKKHRLFSLMYLAFGFLMLSGTAIAQSVPTDNPYRSRYSSRMPAFPYHWTDSIRWNVVVNIADYANLVQRIKDPGTQNDEDSLNDWRASFIAAQNALLAQGGGVIFFPKLPQRGPGSLEPGKDSSYFFSDHLLLKSNVILRGETPSELDARQNTFCPPTYFEFPAYPYSGTFDIPNSVSFKEITIDPSEQGVGKPGFRNVGIVYIDINRGRFAAHPSFRTATVGPNTHGVANEKPRNVLVLGMRSNNVAIPDLNIPNSILPASKIWHRWPWRFAANVDVYVSANCIIAGCRMNDYQNNARNNLRRIEDNSFEQAGYVPNPASGSSPCFPTPSQAKFNYNNHYGVILNRLKKVGYNSTLGFLSNASPNLEPELYAPGNEVVDSWIFKTSRVGIHAAGLGLKISGNVVEDLDTKETAIGPTGATCLLGDYPPCNTPTFENRGIDFCGWNVEIDNNTTKVYRYKLLPSLTYSSDGEGWYFQGASGSTAKGITITNNRFIGSFNGLCDVLCNTNINKGYNGFANSTTIENVLIRNNDFGNIPFRIRVDGAENHNYLIRGLKVYDNINLHSIGVYAKGCGDSSMVYNNTKTPATIPPCTNTVPDLQIDCFTSLNANLNQRNENSNIGFATWPSNPNGDDRPNCGNLCNNGPTCGFPSNSISDPNGVFCFGSNQQVIVTVDYSLAGSCTPDSIVLFRKAGTRVEKVLGSTLSPGSGQATFTSYFTPTNAGWVTEPIYSIVYSGLYSGQSPSVLMKECVSTQPVLDEKTEISLFPNPTHGMVHFDVKSGGRISGITIFDLSGRILYDRKETISDTKGMVDVSSLSKGCYMMTFKVGNQIHRKRLLID